MLVHAKQASRAAVAMSYPLRAEGTPGTQRGFQNSLELMGLKLPFSRNAEIYGQAEPAEYIYKILSGSVRTYKLLDDGRRQIGAFYLPGDVFGIESGAQHRFSAEAMACLLYTSRCV